MPDRAIRAYYEAMADNILPFLRGLSCEVRRANQYFKKPPWTSSL